MKIDISWQRNEIENEKGACYLGWGSLGVWGISLVQAITAHSLASYFFLYMVQIVIWYSIYRSGNQTWAMLLIGCLLPEFRMSDSFQAFLSGLWKPTFCASAIGTNHAQGWPLKGSVGAGILGPSISQGARLCIRPASPSFIVRSIPVLEQRTTWGEKCHLPLVPTSLLKGSTFELRPG